MARGRMISTTIALDPDFNAMSAGAQLAFLRTVPHLDRDGLILGQPSALWATIAPLQPDLLPTMPGIIQEWIDAGLVIVFQTRIGAVLYFEGFHRNQAGLRYDREPKSQLPIPHGYERTPDGIRQTDGNLPESIRQTDGNLPLEDEIEIEIEDEDEIAKLPAAHRHHHPAPAAPEAERVCAAMVANNIVRRQTPALTQTVVQWLTDYPAEWIDEAIGVAAMARAPTPKYMGGILKNWATERGQSNGASSAGKRVVSVPSAAEGASP